MVIDHIGIVVRSLDDAIQRWETLFGYRQNSEVVVNTRQKVKVVFLTKQNSTTVKLIEPLELNTPVGLFARRGGGLHHICFRCQELSTELAFLTANGATILVPPEPGEAFNNNEIAFVMVKDNLNVELIATNERAGWRGDLGDAI